MGKHILGILVLIAATATLIVACFQHTSSTVDDKVYALENGAVCVFAFGLTGILCIVAIFKKWNAVRNYSIAIMLIAVAVAVIPFAVASYRMDATIKYLTQRYTALAKQGPPFPEQKDLNQDLDSKVLIPHGYWLSKDRHAFEIYYYDGSNTFTMAYPKGKWEWRGNKYQGPDSDP